MPLLLAALLIATPAGAATKNPKPPKTPTVKPGYFPYSCSRPKAHSAVRRLEKGDSWRFSKAYDFPFYGYTPRGRNTVIWGFIKNNSLRTAPYPSANLPSCRVGRFGTEDRAAHKAGKYFEMLEPIDGQRVYEFKDTFDRHIATLEWKDESPVSYHPSRWGWYIDGKWAGREATRAFEAQSKACKLMTVPVAGTDAAGQPVTTYQWVRDPRYVMVSFAPNLGAPGRGATPKGVKNLRVRAFLDRRAIPPELISIADGYDQGCGESALPPRLEEQTLKAFYFDSGFGPNNSYLRGYYFGESPTTILTLPGESKLRNTYPLNVYNPRPHYNDATYAVVNTTGVAGGGIVRGIVQSTRDRLTLYDEMRYCDPNYTLRNMQLRKGKKHYKKSLYFPPYTYSAQNKKSVRWVFGRIEPDPTTLTADQAIARNHPASQRLFAWFPINCDR
ncbi:MAG: hypothetical protein JHD02_01290 [Thermoleophilaceae bacterium]|nr:hypothetical protein [Thermoleophilaceae bacterium]